MPPLKDAEGLLLENAGPAVRGAPARARIVANFAALSAAEVLSRVLAFVTLPVVAHLLGPAGLGAVVVAQTIVLYAGTLTDGGLTFMAQRKIVLRPERLSALVMETTAIQLGLAGIALVAIAGLALLVPFSGDTSRMMLLFAPYVVTQALNVAYALQALERMVAFGVIRIVTQVVSAVGTVTFVALTGDAAWVAVMLWGAQLIGDVLTFAFLRRRHRFSLQAPHPEKVRSLLRQGLPFLAAYALFHYVMILDVVTVNLMRSPHEVGEYSAASRLAFAGYLLVTIVMLAVYPEMIRRYAADRARFVEFTRTVMRLAMRLTVAVAALVVVDAGPLTRVLFGSEYAATADLLRVLVCVIPLGWYAALGGLALVAAGRQDLQVRALAAAAVFATVMFPVAVALFGPMGAAVVAVLATAVFAAQIAIYVRRVAALSVAETGVDVLAYGVLPLAAMLAMSSLAEIRQPLVLAAVWLAVTVGTEAASGFRSMRVVLAQRGSSTGVPASL